MKNKQDIGDYNPFSNDGDIYPYQLSLEVIKEKGYVSEELKIDNENGYYAYVYKTAGQEYLSGGSRSISSCCCSCGCSKNNIE